VITTGYSTSKASADTTIELFEICSKKQKLRRAAGFDTLADLLLVVLFSTSSDK
jgi:hypothetical protein